MSPIYRFRGVSKLLEGVAVMLIAYPNTWEKRFVYPDTWAKRVAYLDTWAERAPELCVVL